MAILFVGCSHSSGYQTDVNEKVSLWNSNCYPQIYSQLFDKEVVIYAEAGVGNYMYPNWVKNVLDRHDIEKVVIQSTYWNRYHLMINQNLDYGFGVHTSDYFIDESEPRDEKIIRYTDFFIRENTLQFYTKMDMFQQFRGIDIAVNDGKSNRNIRDVLGELRDNDYSYTKTWFELITPLAYTGFIKDFMIIDRLCEKANIPCYVWRINDRIEMPEQLDFYMPFTNTIFEHQSAEEWIEDRYDLDISKETIDGEHYNDKVHEIIAKDYLVDKFNL